MTTTYNMPGRRGTSVFDFTITENGSYHIDCGYPDGRQGPEAVIAIGTGVAQRILSTLLKCLGSMLLGLGLGSGIIVTVVVLRERAKRKLRSQQQSQPVSMSSAL